MPTLTKHLPKSKLGRELVAAGAEFLGRRGPVGEDNVEYFSVTREQAACPCGPAVPGCETGDERFALTVTSKVIETTDSRGKTRREIKEQKAVVGRRFDQRLIDFCQTEAAEQPLAPLGDLLRDPSIPDKDPALHGRRNAD